MPGKRGLGEAELFRGINTGSKSPSERYSPMAHGSGHSEKRSHSHTQHRLLRAACQSAGPSNDVRLVRADSALRERCFDGP